MNGNFGRFDEENGTWASNQTSNFIWALISDAGGRVFIEDGTGTAVATLEETVNSACLTDSDEAFSGKGCSVILSRPRLESEPKAVCEGSGLETRYRFVLDPFHAQGEMFDFGWYGIVGGLDAFIGSGGVMFRRRTVEADEATLRNIFYNSGNVQSQPSPVTRQRTWAVGQGRSGSDGVCTATNAERGTRQIATQTTNGTAPMPCPIFE